MHSTGLWLPSPSRRDQPAYPSPRHIMDQAALANGDGPVGFVVPCPSGDRVVASAL